MEEEYDEVDDEVNRTIAEVMTARTYYEVLGIDHRMDVDVEEEALRTAYLERSMLLHPDSTSHPDALEAFQRLAVAYDTLSDPVTRKSYDEEIFHGNPRGRRKKKEKGRRSLLEALEIFTQAVHEVAEERNLERKQTVFRRVANFLIWADRVVNKGSPPNDKVDEEELARLRAEEEKEFEAVRDELDRVYEERGEELERAANQRALDNDNDDDDDKNENDRATRGQQWQETPKYSTMPHRQIDGGTRLRRWARGFMRIDTLVSSLLSINQEAERQRRALAEEQLRRREEEDEEEERLERELEEEMQRQSSRDEQIADIERRLRMASSSGDQDGVEREAANMVSSVFAELEALREEQQRERERRRRRGERQSRRQDKHHRKPS